MGPSSGPCGAPEGRRGGWEPQGAGRRGLAGWLGPGHARHLGGFRLGAVPGSGGARGRRRAAPVVPGGARTLRCELEHFNHRFGGWDAQERPGGRSGATLCRASSRASRGVRRGSRDELQPRVAIAREPARPGLPPGTARTPSPRCLAPRSGHAPRTPATCTRPGPRRPMSSVARPSEIRRGIPSRRSRRDNPHQAASTAPSRGAGGTRAPPGGRRRVRRGRQRSRAAGRPSSRRRRAGARRAGHRGRPRPSLRRAP